MRRQTRPHAVVSGVLRAAFGCAAVVTPVVGLVFFAKQLLGNPRGRRRQQVESGISKSRAGSHVQRHRTPKQPQQQDDASAQPAEDPLQDPDEALLDGIHDAAGCMQMYSEHEVEHLHQQRGNPRTLLQALQQSGLRLTTLTRSGTDAGHDGSEYTSEDGQDGQSTPGGSYSPDLLQPLLQLLQHRPLDEPTASSSSGPHQGAEGLGAGSHSLAAASLASAAAGGDGVTGPSDTPAAAAAEGGASSGTPSSTCSCGHPFPGTHALFGQLPVPGPMGAPLMQDDQGGSHARANEYFEALLQAYPELLDIDNEDIDMRIDAYEDLDLDEVDLGYDMGMDYDFDPEVGGYLPGAGPSAAALAALAPHGSYPGGGGQLAAAGGAPVPDWLQQFQPPGLDDYNYDSGAEGDDGYDPYMGSPGDAIMEQLLQEEAEDMGRYLTPAELQELQDGYWGAYQQPAPAAAAGPAGAAALGTEPVNWQQQQQPQGHQPSREQMMQAAFQHLNHLLEIEEAAAAAGAGALPPRRQQRQQQQQLHEVQP